MTDGIIQEVLNPNNVICGDKGTELAIRMYIENKRQELIEKINQKITEHEDYYHIQRGCSLKEELIGDNNE